MKQLLQNLEQQLLQISSLKFIGEDTGQFSLWGIRPNMPWPALLIGLEKANFLQENITTGPKNKQQGQITLRLKLLYAPYGTQGPAPAPADAWKLWDLIAEIQQKVHGTILVEHSSKILRQSISKEERKDTLPVYFIDFGVQLFGL